MSGSIHLGRTCDCVG